MIRFMGAVVLMAGCGGFGFSLSAAHRTEKALLRQLINALQEMEWELKYRLTQLPELCRIGGEAAGGKVGKLLRELAEGLERSEIIDLSASFSGMVFRQELPPRVRRILRELGRSLGRYDLEGQIQGLQAVRMQCRKELKALEQNGPQRLRSYQTLALCAGAALAILLF